MKAKTQAVFIVIALLASVASALPKGFTMTRKNMGDVSSAPVDMRWIDDERALILTRHGEILIAKPNDRGWKKTQYMFLNNAKTADETGALSLALDPDWDNGQKYFYVYWGYEGQNVGSKRRPNWQGDAMRISRFDHDEKSGDLSSRGKSYTQKVIWQDSDGYGNKPMWHYGGSMHFGPDKLLYLTLGDKYMSQWITNNKNNAGCVIRITKDGGIPNGNLPSSIKPAACWAHGLRNGWQAFWDIPANRFIVAEVGGNDDCKSWEDIHIVSQGENLGWPHCEGPCWNQDFKRSCSCKKHDDPIFTYPHKTNGRCGGASLTGGPVIRNTHWPKQYQGAYFYGDYIKGGLNYLEFNNGQDTVKQSHFFHGDLDRAIHISTSPKGDLWILTNTGLGKHKSYHQLIKIDYVAALPNLPPSIFLASASTKEAKTGVPIKFTGVAVDKDTSTLTYEWQFGDGTTSNAANPTHSYANDGEYQAYLYVSDQKSTANSDGIVIVIGTPPRVKVESFSGSSGDIRMGGYTKFRAGETITLIGSGSYFVPHRLGSYFGETELDLPESAFSWEVAFAHGNHHHPLSEAVPGSTMSYTIPDRGHGYEGDTGITFVLTATSPTSGLTSNAIFKFLPRKILIPITSEPSGFPVVIDGHTHLTPFKLETVPGFNHSITLVGCKYTILTFSGWNLVANYVVHLEPQPIHIKYLIDNDNCVDEFKLVGVGYCRGVNGDTGGESRKWSGNIGSEEVCKQKCRESEGCTGIEYQTKGMCELHSMALETVESNPGSKCHSFDLLAGKPRIVTTTATTTTTTTTTTATTSSSTRTITTITSTSTSITRTTPTITSTTTTTSTKRLMCHGVWDPKVCTASTGEVATSMCAYAEVTTLCPALCDACSLKTTITSSTSSTSSIREDFQTGGSVDAEPQHAGSGEDDDTEFEYLILSRLPTEPPSPRKSANTSTNASIDTTFVIGCDGSVQDAAFCTSPRASAWTSVSPECMRSGPIAALCPILCDSCRPLTTPTTITGTVTTNTRTTSTTTTTTTTTPTTTTSTNTSTSTTTTSTTTTTKAELTCVYEAGVDYYGFDITINSIFRATAAAECVQPCLDHPECKVFTFIWGLCFLKTSAEGKVANTKGVGGLCYLDAVAVSTTTTTTTTTTTIKAAPAPVSPICVLVPAVDFYGFDLANGIFTATSPDACVAACLERADCSVFSFIWGLCFLKSSAEGEKANNYGIGGVCREAVPAFSNGVVRVSPAATDAPTTAAPVVPLAATSACNFKEDVDYFGNDIFPAVEATTSMECCPICQARLGCTHFTFIWGKCWLKTSGAGEVANTHGVGGTLATAA
jgi:PKD repeat protein